MDFSSLFWNKDEKRFSAFLRILLFLLLASLLSLPLALLGDSMNEFVEKSFTNVLVMVAILVSGLGFKPSGLEISVAVGITAVYLFQI